MEGLKEFLVKSPEEALAFMAAGERRKHIAESEWEEEERLSSKNRHTERR